MPVSPFEDGVEPAMIDRVLAVLSEECRRRVLAYFEGYDEDVASLDDLVEHVAASRDDPNRPARHRVRVRLRHVDLPKLRAAGLLDYDAATATVRYRGAPPGVRADAWSALVADPGAV